MAAKKPKDPRHSEMVAYAKRALEQDPLSASHELIRQRFPDPEQAALAQAWSDEMARMAGMLRRLKHLKDPGSTDALSHNELVSRAAKLSRDRQPVPGPLGDFIADVLEGKRGIRKKRGPDPEAKIVRDAGLLRAFEAVAKEFCMPRYSNNELFVGTTTANIVAEAAGLKTDAVVQACRRIQLVIDAASNETFEMMIHLSLGEK